MNNIGIIITASRFDIHFARGTVASVRHFCGDIPIMLLTDGKLPVAGFKNRYGVQVLEQQQVADDYLRKHARGFGLTKLCAFAASPWPYFMHLDADMLMWGNVPESIPYADYDLVLDVPTFEYPLEYINYNLFDTEKLQQVDTAFKVMGRPYFVSGTWIARKDAMNLNDLYEIIELHRTSPGLFMFADQGILNYLFLKGEDNQKYKVLHQRFQYVMIEHEKEAFMDAFPLTKLQSAYSEPMTIHYNGRSKPHLKNKHGYNTDLFTYFRKLYYGRDSFVNLKLHWEDGMYTYLTQKAYFKKRIRQRLGI